MSTPEQSPEHVAVRAEVGKIQTDPTHPLHAGFKANSPEYNAHVDGLYKKFVPAGSTGKVEIGDSVKVGGTPAERDSADADAAGEFAKANEAVLSAQWKEWGAEAPTNLAMIKEYATEHFGSKPGMLEGLMAAALKEGLNPAEINQKLLEMARQARAGKAS